MISDYISFCYSKNVQENVMSREMNDLGVLRFDIHADLSNVFNWNVQQLFIYLVAEYTSKKNDINQVGFFSYKYWS